MNISTNVPRTAFVTGGSGFVGSRLIQQLVSQGWRVRALARSEQARKLVIEAGAEFVSGEMNELVALTNGMKECEVVFHAAAHFRLWGKLEVFNRVNVEGMDAVINAAVATKSVRKIVYVSAAAVIMGDPIPMIEVDETLPYQSRTFAPYSSSKAEAERRLLQANGKREGLETVAIRPPMIWGKGMPMLDQMAEAVKAGQWKWVDSGGQAIAMCHVDNLVHALMLAADRGKGGKAILLQTRNMALRKACLRHFSRQKGSTHRTSPFRSGWHGSFPVLWKQSGLSYH